MRTYKFLTLSLLLASAALTACVTNGESDASATTGNTPTTGGTTSDGSGGTTNITTPTTTDGTTAGPTTGGGGQFVFDETPPDELVQVDRMGMPAVAASVISANMKDAYNEATPADDAASTFVPDIITNLVALHAALDDDLAGIGLTPCDPMTKCANQGAPLVVPDTLKINVGETSGFPNGRRLDNPVIDLTLAVIMLDLALHPVDSFANIPLNPPANDKEFLADFPYLATPH